MAVRGAARTLEQGWVWEASGSAWRGTEGRVAENETAAAMPGGVTSVGLGTEVHSPCSDGTGCHGPVLLAGQR